MTAITMVGPNAKAECDLTARKIVYYWDEKHTQAINSQMAFEASDGSVLFKEHMMINFDGFKYAYHKNNIKGGAVLNLCNAGKVFLPDGSSYSGSESDETCTGKFLQDYRKIGKAGWHDPTVGLINWYGVLGKDNVKIHGQVVKRVEPIEQNDGSGFFVSPTALADETNENDADQSRYLDATKIPAAVVRGPKLVSDLPVVAGTFGVAYDLSKKVPVPFVVGDYGPKVGEATPALARKLEDVDPSVPFDRKHRYAGGVDERRIVWIFFRNAGQAQPPFDEQTVTTAAQKAFEKWGGEPRLQECVDGL
ncbi:hypothetical protein [Rhizobium sp. CCGE 510]|uniref:hypothetical protein n=1 Tax=Rhizobium sp. CCGE 510 TaxID=1132836 RepID=UPI00027B7E83|nr:hypothetical protein [Rhizobium sp. CCGE 510]EJT04963.1 hypothetical protein RCCGE510_12546 [Rhizobium sp. CCGE 510]